MEKSASATQHNMKTPLVRSIDLMVSIIQILALHYFGKPFCHLIASIVVVILVVIALVIAGTKQ